MKIKLFIACIFYSLTLSSQTNPWLPPFEMNCDDVVEMTNSLKSMNCAQTSNDYNNLTI